MPLPAPTNESPAKDYAAVTPSDSVDIQRFRGLWVGVEGDVALVSVSGSVVTFKNVVGLLDAGGVRVNDTNTTATDIVALY